jgi:hypothetical protein
MESYAPEFARYWLAAGESDASRHGDRHEDEVRAERQALEELVERVNAARSIV